MSKKYYTRKRFSNNKSRRHKRIHQRGGSKDHLLRFILGLDINPIVKSFLPNEINDTIKVAYAYSMVNYLIHNERIPTGDLKGRERTEKVRGFIHALHDFLENYGVSDNVDRRAYDDVTLDFEGRLKAEMENVETRKKYTARQAVQQMFVKFLSDEPIPVITSGIADRTRSKRNIEELEEYEQIQPRKKRTSMFTLETTSKPESTITLGDKQTYNFNEMRDMWNYNKVETPKRYKYSEEDKTRIKNFLQYGRTGGKMSRKKRKMRKTRKTKY